MYFIIEQSCIDYIRDYYKFIVFNVIKARCSKHNTNSYITSQEILEDLNNIYDEFDFYEKADARLYNSDFKMQKKKTFNEFLARYTAIIALLQLSEQ